VVEVIAQRNLLSVFVWSGRRKPQNPLVGLLVLVQIRLEHFHGTAQCVTDLAILHSNYGTKEETRKDIHRKKRIESRQEERKLKK
jgi:hypothetical protein